MAQGDEPASIATIEQNPGSNSNNDNSNPILSFITKFLAKLQEDNNKQENNGVVNGEEGSRTEANKPDVVRFPLSQGEKVTPIKLESEEVERDTNPVVLWQVYALGGFIVLKWVWGKWQERKANAKKDSPGEENPPADD